MTSINNFLDKIKYVLDSEPSDDDFDLFNDLETYFIDNNEDLYKESVLISDLGYEMQDIIAEISFMEDTTQYRLEIQKIYEKMNKCS